MKIGNRTFLFFPFVISLVIALAGCIDDTSPVPGGEGFITVSSVTVSSANIAVTAAVDNCTDAEELTYELYSSVQNNITTLDDVTSNGTSQGDAAANTISFSLTGLSAGTTYYVNVLVADTTGNQAAYTSKSFTTSTVADSTSPTPGNSGALSFSSVGEDSIDVNWTLATDDTSSQANLQYLVYYSTSNNISTVSTAEINGTAAGSYAADIASKTVGSLTASTTYYFVVIVKDEADNKAAYTSSSQATTAPADSTPPTPGNSGTITFASVTDVSLDVNWTAATDDTSAQANLEYLVYYSTSNNITTVNDAETNGTAVGSYAANITSKSVTSLTASTTYYFNVIVKDESDNKAAYTANSQATTAPAEPVPGNSGTITSSNVYSASLTLNWTKATDDVTAQSSLTYTVYQSTSNNISSVADMESNGTVCSCSTANPGTDIATIDVNGLSGNTQYYFNIIVTDGDTNKSAYTTVTVTTNP